MDHLSEVRQKQDPATVIQLDGYRPSETLTRPARGADLDDWPADGAILCW